MANTKIPSELIADDAVTAALLADNSVGIAALNVSDGSNGQALTTNGSGTLSFSTVAVDQTLTIVGRSSNTNITITSGTLTVVGRAGNVNVGV
tara:strand:- start:400 stop:678 length:279 start_codon:yes stop_codon:yes gene_type:complete